MSDILCWTSLVKPTAFGVSPMHERNLVFVAPIPKDLAELNNENRYQASVVRTDVNSTYRIGLPIDSESRRNKSLLSCRVIPIGDAREYVNSQAQVANDLALLQICTSFKNMWEIHEGNPNDLPALYGCTSNRHEGFELGDRCEFYPHDGLKLHTRRRRWRLADYSREIGNIEIGNSKFQNADTRTLLENLEFYQKYMEWLDILAKTTGVGFAFYVVPKQIFSDLKNHHTEFHFEIAVEVDPEAAERSLGKEFNQEVLYTEEGWEEASRVLDRRPVKPVSVDLDEDGQQTVLTGFAAADPETTAAVVADAKAEDDSWGEEDWPEDSSDTAVPLKVKPHKGKARALPLVKKVDPQNVAWGNRDAQQPTKVAEAASTVDEEEWDEQPYGLLANRHPTVVEPPLAAAAAAGVIDLEVPLTIEELKKVRQLLSERNTGHAPHFDCDIQGLLPDHEIRRMMRENKLLVSDGTPTERGQLRKIIESGRPIRREGRTKCLSYGISSFGYDTRLGYDFQWMTYNVEPMEARQKFRQAGLGIPHGIIDPLSSFDSFAERGSFTSEEPFLLMPHTYILGHTLEVFDMPSDVLAICLGKSTYARCGLVVNVTPIEPGFQGQVTLELGNITNHPIVIYPGQGVCQFLFLRGSKPDADYASRSGKYQGQLGVTPARA